MIVKASFESIKHLIPLAKKDNLCFCNNTIYYAYYKDGKVVGFSGILFYENKAVIKNHYVIETYRGLGLFKEMLDYCLTTCKMRGYKHIEATCTFMSINEYVKKGFKIIKEYKAGFKKVRYEDLW